jgi:hypothetical protein
MKKLPLILTLVGGVPFIVLSILISVKSFNNTKDALDILLTYAAVIISFLGGIHWGFAVHQFTANRPIANMLIAESIVPSLIAWGVLLYPDHYVQLLVFTLLYTFTWGIDSLLYNNNLMPQWFFNIRCVITPVVVVSLYVAYFGMV